MVFARHHGRAAAVVGGTSGLRVVRLHGHTDYQYPDVRGPDAELGNLFRSHRLHLSRTCGIFRGGRIRFGHTQLGPSPTDGRSDRRCCELHAGLPRRVSDVEAEGHVFHDVYLRSGRACPEFRALVGGQHLRDRRKIDYFGR